MWVQLLCRLLEELTQVRSEMLYTRGKEWTLPLDKLLEMGDKLDGLIQRIQLDLGLGLERAIKPVYLGSEEVDQAFKIERSIGQEGEIKTQ